MVHSMAVQEFRAGATILNQGAAVTEDDFMYLLSSGEVDVVISGGQVTSEDHKVGGPPSALVSRPEAESVGAPVYGCRVWR